MVSASTRKGCYISILNIIQGAVDPTQVYNTYSAYNACYAIFSIMLNINSLIYEFFPFLQNGTPSHTLGA